jgi:hypothetical protein
MMLSSGWTPGQPDSTDASAEHTSRFPAVRWRARAPVLATDSRRWRPPPPAPPARAGDGLMPGTPVIGVGADSPSPPTAASAARPRTGRQARRHNPDRWGTSFLRGCPTGRGNSRAQLRTQHAAVVFMLLRGEPVRAHQPCVGKRDRVVAGDVHTRPTPQTTEGERSCAATQPNRHPGAGATAVGRVTAMGQVDGRCASSGSCPSRCRATLTSLPLNPVPKAGSAA